ncbi:O-methyltransferase-domain-containing protein [Aspergillus unguis]
MDDLILQIRDLASKANDAEKIKIQSTLRAVASDLESPQDTLMQLYNGCMYLAVVRIGTRSGLFRSLSQSQGPLSVTQLAEQSNASPQLFERITRYLAANQLIEEVKQGYFKANRSTHVLGSQDAEVAVSHLSTFSVPAMQAFPGFAHETGYTEVTNNLKTPFQKGFSTELTVYDWLAQHPEAAERFKNMMKLTQSGGWMLGFEEFNKEALSAELHPETAFFVDVGGNSGHQCLAVLEKYPGLKGRLVLEDLPQVITELPEIPGVRLEATDIFQEQKIKGAKFYYLRRILHNWPDNDCVQILRNLRFSMAKDSRILIDDAVVPETNAPWQPALADLAMMIMMGGKERTRTQWAMLAEQAGLRIAHIHQYSNDLVNFHSVVVLALN